MKRNKNRIRSTGGRIRIDKRLIVLTVVSAVAAAAMISSFNSLKAMACFRVRKVYTRYPDRISEDCGEFCYLKGKNIFTIDLVREAAKISDVYPTYKRIRLTRFLPDKIVIDLLKREPLAQLKAGKLFFVDEYLVVFEPPVQENRQGLPLICGLEKKLGGLGYGTRLAYPELKMALDIIKKAKANSVLRDYPIARVEVSDPENASIFMLVQKGLLDYTSLNPKNTSGMIEVKLGSEDLAGKLSVLATVLRQVRNNLAGIKYIDLRFKEPVIKLKNPAENS